MSQTMRLLDGNTPLASQGSSRLGDWYESIRDVPLDQLRTGDICRALRQNLFLKQLLPIAFDRILQDPAVGELYDGEMVSALATLHPSFWINMPTLAADARKLLHKASANLDEDIRAEVNAFLLHHEESKGITRSLDDV